MLNLAWGGFANGSAALRAVCVQAAGGIPGDMLEQTTAIAWANWRNLVHQDTGVWLYLDHSDLIAPGLRDIPNQQAAYDRYRRDGRPVASPPGQSNHGWGRALDVTGFENSTAVWNSMVARAAQCGLSNATGAASGERWHWECILPPTTTASSGASTLIQEGFLMALTDAEQAEVLDKTRNIHSGLYVGGPALPDGNKSIAQSLFEMHTILAQQINRNGVKNSQIQELADTKTIGLQLLAQVAALQQALTHVSVAQGADPAAIQAAAKAGAEEALAGLTLKTVV